jgi:hypothetical protein
MAVDIGPDDKPFGKFFEQLFPLLSKLPVIVDGLRDAPAKLLETETLTP